MRDGFTAADLTVVVVIATCSSTSSDEPARSANAITGTSPAHDTRFCSSNSGGLPGADLRAPLPRLLGDDFDHVGVGTEAADLRTLAPGLTLDGPLTAPGRRQLRAARAEAPAGRRPHADPADGARRERGDRPRPLSLPAPGSALHVY
ncbi:hypothetical protein GCM10023317_93690 [Actinopolymorpha pittospori]